MNVYQNARNQFKMWEDDLHKNIFSEDADYVHTIQYYFPDDANLMRDLIQFGDDVPNLLEPFVAENNKPINLPRLENYDSFGGRIDHIVHHPTYNFAGEIIYRTGLLAKLTESDGLSKCLALLFLSSAAGEAGHNCPIACSAGIIRVLNKIADFPLKKEFLEKLLEPSYQNNFTGAQFVTEIQGGSDVGLNATYAEEEEKNIWRIYGEKWFCSNADADLFFVVARYLPESTGTNGLGLFLVPAIWEKYKNRYIIRRLKDKIGTRSMATGEIDFEGAYAIPMGLEDGFHLTMDNVLHLSRLFNTCCVIGMARRAFTIAKYYAKHRVAFSNSIIHYPLVQENLAKIKAENTAMLAACFATTHLQDEFDKKKIDNKDEKLLLRLLVNIQKYLSAKLSIDHAHHALDVLAGNGTIESFSSLPRLLRDGIICENWEGTHNALRAQVHRDILKYHVDKIYVAFMHENVAKIKEVMHKKKWYATLTDLEIELSNFKTLSTNLQSLKIREIVDKLAFCFCGLMLYFEAEHQRNTVKSFSKWYCYEYFFMLHIDSQKINLDNNYLTLIQRVLLL